MRTQKGDHTPARSNISALALAKKWPNKKNVFQYFDFKSSQSTRKKIDRLPGEIDPPVNGLPFIIKKNPPWVSSSRLLEIFSNLVL